MHKFIERLKRRFSTIVLFVSMVVLFELILSFSWVSQEGVSSLIESFLIVNIVLGIWLIPFGVAIILLAD